MQHFREAVNGKLVEIDDEVFFVDGIRIPIKAIWGTKGVYYYLNFRRTLTAEKSLK